MSGHDTRNSTSRKTKLTTRPSPYHAAVTLVETESLISESSTGVRRSKRVKLEDSVSLGSALGKDTYDDDGPAKKPRTSKQKSPRKPKRIPQSLETPHAAPAKWKDSYDIIKDMRSRMIAPVDTMGCDRAHLKEENPQNQRFTTLVSLMLSAQTKDEVCDAAVTKLREAVGGTLSIAAILQADKSAISKAISKVGFWRKKTQYIKQTAQILHDEFDSDVPKTVDELCSLPGVGKKMAFLTLLTAWNLNLGIGVDVHVHRITNRLGWHKPATKKPEQTRLNLQSWLPKELHAEINHLLVGFGQMICLPVGPRCDLCELSSNELCPSAREVVQSKSRKIIVLEAKSGPKLEVAVETESMPLVSDLDAKHELDSVPSPLTDND